MTAGERPQGLTASDAARRLAERPPSTQQNASRSYASIVRANVFTRINAILGHSPNPGGTHRVLV